MSEQHGSVIASFCYETPGEVSPEDYRHRRIGKLVYYRSHSPDKDPSAQIRLDLIPAAAWAAGIEYFIGNFEPSEKVPDAPFIDGDITAATEDRGDHVVVGHIHTRERESDGAVQFYMRIFGIPVREWIKIRDSDKERKSIYLGVRQ